MKLRLAVLFACLMLLTPAQAVEPGEVMADPALEARARDLSADLRCLVCQNQSIDDSNAPLARDLRLLVRERLKTGASDAEVRDFLVSRYGDFVLLRPPVTAATMLLWATPILALGGGIAVIMLRRRRALAEAAALSPEEARRLAELDRGAA
jgi:cytochrome c-type biogenesis protein CcmH